MARNPTFEAMDVPCGFCHEFGLKAPLHVCAFVAVAFAPRWNQPRSASFAIGLADLQCLGDETLFAVSSRWCGLAGFDPGQGGSETIEWLVDVFNTTCTALYMFIHTAEWLRQSQQLIEFDLRHRRLV